MKILFLLLLLLIIIFLILFGILYYLGLKFDIIFWQNFFQSILYNVPILFLVIFLIDQLIKKDTKAKLKKINQQTASYIFFSANRLIFWLLEYLELATKEGMKNDEELNFLWARKKLELLMKGSKILNIFYTKLINKKDRKEFVDKFIDLINKALKNIEENINKIYPHPSSDIKDSISQIYTSCGALSVIGEIVTMVNQVSERAKKENKLNKEEIENLFIKIAWIRLNYNLEKIFENIKNLSLKAEKNEIFAVL